MVDMGKYGELCAARYLRDHKWHLHGANFHSRFGEIDLIASNSSFLIFVEVKTRDAASIAAPREFVDVHKQRRIIQTAEYYLSCYPAVLQPRFDVIEVITKQGKAVKINHIENAFELEGNE